MILQDAIDALVSVLFPAPCRICGDTLRTASRIPICAACLESIEPLSGPCCERCGRPFVSATAAACPVLLCHACQRGVYAFDRVRSFARYNDVMSEAIVLLKYHGVTRLGAWFAERLAEMLARDAENFRADVIVPVPLHALRQRERGYNQAELIARPLARRLRWPIGSYLLVRTKPRPDKLLLSRRERWQSVRGAYVTRDDAQVDNLRILLVDDVFTTGATLDACSRALRRAGAASVYGLTVARVVPNWLSPSEVGRNQPPGPSIEN